MELAIGIDIGGTSTKVALVDLSGKILARHSFPSHAPGGAAAYFPNLTRALGRLLEATPPGIQLMGIGVGAPSCNEAAGTIEGAANLPFQDPFPLVNLLQQAYAVPVRLTKDSNVALLGESRFGAARGIRNLILLTLGTGLGGSIMANGKLVKGGWGMAGEIGHIRVVNNRRKCACGKIGCLETYVSALGLKRTAVELMAVELADSPLRALSFEKLTAQLIYRAAVAGDEIARLTFEITGTLLGGKMAELVAVFEPEVIVLAGGMADAGVLLTEPLQKQMEEDLLSFHKNKVRILNTSLDTNEAALLGAASLIWDQQPTMPLG